MLRPGKSFRKGLAAIVSVGALSLATAPGASAAVTCSFPIGGQVDVVITAGATFAELRHNLGTGQILVNATTCTGTGGTATAANTDKIRVTESGMGVESTVEIDLTDGGFQPGVDEGPTGSPEIEFQLDTGPAGMNDSLQIIGGTGNDDYRIGTDGANLNPIADLTGAIPALDIDVTFPGDGIESKLLFGETGDDQIFADGSDITPGALTTPVSIFGGAGNDVVYGGTMPDQLFGGADTDLLKGRAGNDSYFGGTGNDTFDGADGAGGGDIEAANYGFASGGVTVNLNSLPTINTGPDGIDTITGNFDVLYGSPHADVLTGDGEAQSIYGQAGNDIVDGGPNNDTVFGVFGADLVRGGLGDDSVSGLDGGPPGEPPDPGDTLVYDTAPSGVTVTGLGTGAAYGSSSGGHGTDVIGPFQNVIGSPSADSITGDSLANTLSGGGGSDVLFGLGGPDALNGEAGMDTLGGGDGDDVFSGGTEGDSLVGDAGADSGSGDAGSDLVNGGDGDDNLGGGADSDVVSGFAGADTVNGDGGADSVDGGAGNDSADGGSEDDTVNGGSENDVVHGGSENDVVSGDDGNDMVFGDAGKDALLGLAGIDKLFAKDRTKDARIHCGPGSNKKESAKFDKTGKPKKRDPLPRSC